MAKKNKKADLKVRPAAIQPDVAPAEESPEYVDHYGAELGVRHGEPSEAELEGFQHVRGGSAESRENLQQMREENSARVSDLRFPRQELHSEENEERLMGRILHASDFIQGLRRCGIIAVYVRMPLVGKIKSLYGADRANERAAEWERKTAALVVMGSIKVQTPNPRYVTWVPMGPMPEHSVLRFDAHGLPTTEKYRGWRTVLIELIRQGYLSEAECNRVFGLPRAQIAVKWNEVLQSMRSQGLA